MSLCVQYKQSCEELRNNFDFKNLTTKSPLENSYILTAQTSTYNFNISFKTQIFP